MEICSSKLSRASTAKISMIPQRGVDWIASSTLITTWLEVEGAVWCFLSLGGISSYRTWCVTLDDQVSTIQSLPVLTAFRHESLSSTPLVLQANMLWLVGSRDNNKTGGRFVIWLPLHVLDLVCCTCPISNGSFIFSQRPKPTYAWFAISLTKSSLSPVWNLKLTIPARTGFSATLSINLHWTGFPCQIPVYGQPSDEKLLLFILLKRKLQFGHVHT